MTMQDRFKVRAWDNEKKEFRKTYPSYIYSQCITNPRRYIVEQCIGLKDKNGKLIYEGDIVKDNEGLIAPVCFDEVNAMFYIDKYIGVYNYPFAYFYHYDSEEELEVIGNIHENPDLLENKDE